MMTNLGSVHVPLWRTFKISAHILGLLSTSFILNGATGRSVPELSAFDEFVNTLLDRWQIPGAAIAVSHNGRLVLSRGYGHAELHSRPPRRRRSNGDVLVQPDSLFRIGQISKTLTAMAVLRLAEEGQLSLDDQVYSLVTSFDGPKDPRSREVTVRDLLQMTGTWEGHPNFDPSPDPNSSANYDFPVLGRIIEKVSGQTYEDYVRSAVLGSLGATRMRLGHTTLEGRAEGEVQYYDYPGARSVRSVVRKHGKAPQPYGAVSLEALDSAAGWIGSAGDLLRIINALDGRRPPMLLKQASLPAMMARPSTRTAAAAPAEAGVGWVTEQKAPDSDWWMLGEFSGSVACVYRQAGTGVDVAVLFNSRPLQKAAFESELSAGLVRTVNSISAWPPIDQYASGPELFARDIVNAAGRVGGGIAPGEIVVLFPSNAGPAQMVEWPAGSAGRTRVFFDNTAAPIVYTMAGQVSAIVPHEVSAKASTSVSIEYEGVRSPPVTVPVVPSAPAFFTRDATGKGQAAMLNVTGCCNSARNPVMRGAIAYLFATGEGFWLSPEDRKFIAEKPSPVPVPVSSDLKVTIGGVPAEVLYAGDAGVLQVNIRVPENAPIGEAVPLSMTVGNSRSPDGVTVAVRSSAQRLAIIQHNEQTRADVARALESAGYQTVSVLDEIEAAGCVKDGPVDLVITDLAMPRSSTASLIRTIQDQNPELKIMVLLEDAGPKSLRAADLLGAQAVLPESVKPEELLNRVHDVLQAHYVAF